MITLRQIISATPAPIKARAAHQCYGQAIPSRRGGADEYQEFNFKVRCTDGWRKTSCRFFGPLHVDTKVWVFCNCPYFKYHCEVALAHKGSSTVVHSNGQRPRFTNPGLEPRVCKHVYLLLALVLKKRDRRSEQGREIPAPVKLPALPVPLPPLK